MSLQPPQTPRQASAIDTPVLFAHLAQKAPDRHALRAFVAGRPELGERLWTWRELANDLSACAVMFEQLGLGETRRAAILLPTVPEVHLLLWGGMAVCGVGLINPLLRSDHIAHLLDAMQVECLFVATAALHPGLSAIGAQLAAQRPGLRVVTVGPGGELDSLMALARQAGLVSRPRSASAIGALFHTGGTTGRPKIAPLSLDNIFTAARMVQAAGAFSDEDRFLCPLPLFHIAGAVCGGLAPFLSGGQIILPAPSGMRDPAVLANFWRMIEWTRATMMAAVPTSLATLAVTPLNGADISSLDYVLTGTAPLPGETARRFKVATGLQVHTGYGMTETAGIISFCPRGGPERPSTVGIPAAGLELRIAPLDGAPQSGVGRVEVRGPNVINGYLGAPSRSPDDWFDTGDLGFLDDGGWLTLTGRSKDVIIRSGHNIDPATIEELALGHEAVVSAAAVGQIDEHAGEIPVLFVQLHQGTDEARVFEDLADLLRRQVAEPPARPAFIYAVDAMPLTAVGKIFKPQLRADAAQRCLSAVLSKDGFGLAHCTVENGSTGELLVSIDGVPADQQPRLKNRLLGFPLVIKSMGREPC